MIDIEYLGSGTPLQQEVYRLLSEHRLVEVLEAYDPILVGTVPLDIQIPDSDLDLICEVHHFEAFRNEVTSLFGHYPGFSVHQRVVQGIPRIKVNFHCMDWPVELFGQPIPTHLQNGYRHMIVEARMLAMYGESFKQRIISLKLAGLKTEPAFAKLLHLDGDPYERLLELADKSDLELLKLLPGEANPNNISYEE